MLRANSCLTFSFRVQKAVVHTQSPESLARFPFLWMIWVSANSNGGDGAENERHLSTSGLCNKKRHEVKEDSQTNFIQASPIECSQIYNVTTHSALERSQFYHV